ncbi:uncharacterized protein A4U43_C02F7050 [Asparagus officinalis]|uniref:Uncharacterized protein n=1 Tax=Asparagus officinalis TaxID=4686 RepID=A0A5P1FGI4_ASPOF|nr:uncharacterized protein LOC109829423 [Asparagus officinalis]ONK77485.1 uncharacterized protein A4U43_C02F7050 [Asparagus officinalis]
MSGKESKKHKVPEVLSWQQKKERADADEVVIKNQVEELFSWTTMIQNMTDDQLKEYVLNRPKNLNLETKKKAPVKKAKKERKPRASSSSLGIMASIWKFHKEDDDEAACNIPV